MSVPGLRMKGAKWEMGCWGMHGGRRREGHSCSSPPFPPPAEGPPSSPGHLCPPFPGDYGWGAGLWWGFSLWLPDPGLMWLLLPLRGSQCVGGSASVKGGSRGPETRWRPCWATVRSVPRVHIHPREGPDVQSHVC